MSILKKNLPDVTFLKNNKDHKITILFCPISSRTGADVTAAMSEVKGKEYYNAFKKYFKTLVVSIHNGCLFNLSWFFFTVL